MSDTSSPLSTRVGLDVADFKSGISQLNQGVRVIESGFKASAAALGDWSKDAGGLESRIKSLNGEIELQDKKVGLLSTEYKKVAAAKGEDSRAAQDLQIKLNKATEELNRMKSEVGKNETALKELKAGGTEPAKNGVKDLGKESGNTEKKMSSLKGIASGLKSVLGGVGAAAKATVSALAGVAAGAVGAVAGLGALVINSAKTADDLDELSQKTGVSTTELQYLSYISKQTGTDFDTITGSMARLVRSMDATAKSPAGEAFAKLGIKTKEANGHVRDSRVVFNEAIQALGGISDETERDTISMALFGKSAQELNPLILTGAAGLAQMRSEADKVGAIVPEDQIKRAAELNDKIDKLKTGFQGIVMQVAGMFVPAVSGAADQVSGFMTRLAGAVGMFQSNPQAAQLMITSLVSDMLAQVPKVLGIGLTILKVLITAILSALPTLLPAAIGLIKTLMGFLVTSLPLIMQAGFQIVSALIMGIVPMLPQLLQSGLKMLVQLLQGILAALPQIIPVITSVVLEMINTLTTMLPQILTLGIQVLMALINGIVAALPQIIPAVVQLVLTLAMAIIQNLPVIVEAALNLIMALAQGLIAALPVLIAAIPDLMNAIVATIIKLLPMIITVAAQLITALVLGIVQNLPALIKAIADGIGKIVATFKATNWKQIGSDLVNGVSKGFMDQWEAFKKNVAAAFAGMVTTLKNLLGIKSPSTVFAGIGKNMAMGLGLGFQDQIRQVERNIAAATRGLSMSGNLAMSGAGAGGGRQDNSTHSTFNNYGTVIYPNGAGTQASPKAKRF
jgi:phage-related protein